MTFPLCSQLQQLVMINGESNLILLVFQEQKATKLKEYFPRRARIQFVFTSNDYRQNWTTQIPITDLL